MELTGTRAFDSNITFNADLINSINLDVDNAPGDTNSVRNVAALKRNMPTHEAGPDPKRPRPFSGASTPTGSHSGSDIRSLGTQFHFKDSPRVSSLSPTGISSGDISSVKSYPSSNGILDSNSTIDSASAAADSSRTSLFSKKDNLLDNPLGGDSEVRLNGLFFRAYSHLSYSEAPQIRYEDLPECFACC